MLSAGLEQFVEPIMAMCRSQFPRMCSTCKHQFDDLGQWVRVTDPIGVPTLDEETETDPFGMVSWVNCACGSTLILKCQDMDGPRHLQFTQALAAESASTGRDLKELLQDLRRTIRQRTLGEPL